MPKREVKKRGYADFGVIANPAKVSQGFLAELRASVPAWRQAQAAQAQEHGAQEDSQKRGVVFVGHESC
jgi:hypothetical protein